MESRPLTDEQARAVVTFDNRVQVLATDEFMPSTPAVTSVWLVPDVHAASGQTNNSKSPFGPS